MKTSQLEQDKGTIISLVIPLTLELDWEMINGLAFFLCRLSKLLRSPQLLNLIQKKIYSKKQNNKKASAYAKAFYVIQSGFEPETYCLEGSCSIQLSYWTDPKIQ